MNKFSSARSCYILAQRRVRSTWGSPLLINSLSRSSLLSGMIWLQRRWWRNAYLLCEVSLVDVKDGKHNGNDEKHCLKSAFHFKQYSSPLCVRVSSDSGTLLIIYWVTPGLKTYNSDSLQKSLYEWNTFQSQTLSKLT